MVVLGNLALQYIAAIALLPLPMSLAHNLITSADLRTQQHAFET